MVELSVDDAKREIKERVSLVDFLRGNGFELRKKGGRYWALCPFHDEKTPSFSVNDETRSYHCFGCGKSGDVFTYMEEKENLSFMEAVESLAAGLDIKLKRTQRDENEPDRKTLLRIVKATAAWYWKRYAELPEDHPAKIEVSKRGLSTSSKDHYDLLGWAPENSKSLIDHLRSLGFKDDDMVASGVIRRSDDGRLYSLLRARLTFVITDILNRPIGFSGRRIFGDTKDRKYVNSPDSTLFHKAGVLFCESIAKKQAAKDHEMFVVEGQFDVLAMQSVGKTNTVASSGTAFTEQHAGLMRRFVGEKGRVVFCFDADDAGQAAAMKAFVNLPSLQGQAYATITKDKDPSDMYRDDPKSLLEQVNTITPLWKHVLLHVVGQHDMTTDQGRKAFIVDFAKLYEATTDSYTADSMLKLASVMSSVPVDVLSSKGRSQTTAESTAPIVDAVETDTGVDALVDNLLALMLENPDLRSRLPEVDLRGVRARRFALWLTNHQNAKVIPELFASTAAEAYVRRLDALAQRLHEYDEFMIPADPAELFEQQKTIIAREQARRRTRDALLSTAATADSTDPDVLAAVEDKVRRSRAS